MSIFNVGEIEINVMWKILGTFIKLLTIMFKFINTIFVFLYKVDFV